jgi:formylglycine-generating enzyme required for sulfatase activity
MVRVVDPGEFLMGSALDDPDWLLGEAPHRARVPRGFAIAAREVTCAEFETFLDALGPKVLSHDLDRLCPSPEGAMPRVSWFMAIKYCRWLSEREGIREDQMCYPPIKEIEQAERNQAPLRLPADLLLRTGYRLATQVEWEYACRVGSTSSRFFGNSDRLLGRYAWYVHNSSGRTWPVGQKRPNDLGLFDLYGNVYEWCQDGASMNDTSFTPGLPPHTSVTEGTGRLMRGGSFDHQAYVARSSMTFRVSSLFASSWAGFRVARTLAPKTPPGTSTGELLTRAYRAAHRGDWKKALKRHALVVERDPDDLEALCSHAGLLALAGRGKELRLLCDRLLATPVEPDDPRSAYLIARACVLAAGAAADLAPAGPLVKQALAEGRWSWHLHTQGLLHHRQGRHEQAVKVFHEALEANPKWEANAVNWLGLALAYHALGKDGEARRWHSRATKWLTETAPRLPGVYGSPFPMHPHDWLGCQVLRQEADRALTARPPR